MTYISHLRGQRDTAQATTEKLGARVVRLTEVVDGQHETINHMNAIRQIDAETIAKMYETNQSLTREMSARLSTRQQLEKTNVAVKSYLDQPVPDELRSLLNRQITGSGGKDGNQDQQAASRPAQ